MAIKHGVFVKEVATSVSTPVLAECGVPFVIGTAPIHTAAEAATVGLPKLCTSFDDFVNAFGYSEDWEKYTLCEFAYSHFKLYGVQPAIFCNVYNPVKASETAKTKQETTGSFESVEVGSDIHGVKVDSMTPNDAVAVITYDDAGVCKVSFSKTVTAYKITYYDNADTSTVTPAVVASNMDAVDYCMSQVGLIPDLIAAPGFSSNNEVAAIMATKAAGINGLFSAKAVVDVDSSTVTKYDAVHAWKTTNNFVDENMIVCWPMLSLGSKTYHMSTALCGLMAQIDAENEAPYESPSNKNFQMDKLVLASGDEVVMTKEHADILNNAGVVTALNFLSSGWVAWGNYTACYPSNTDVKDYFTPISRMFDWVGNTVIRTFWSKLDKPMNRRLVDTIIDSANIWLNGLVGRGFLLGARAEVIDAENPLTDLMAGIIRVHIFMTPPSPAQEIDFLLEYDVDYVANLFAE